MTWISTYDIELPKIFVRMYEDTSFGNKNAHGDDAINDWTSVYDKELLKEDERRGCEIEYERKSTKIEHMLLPRQYH